MRRKEENTSRQVTVPLRTCPAGTPLRDEERDPRLRPGHFLRLDRSLCAVLGGNSRRHLGKSSGGAHLLHVGQG